MHSMRSRALHLRLHWIGPTHGDIIADCVAKAFGVPIDSDPRALAILHEWVKTIGAKERGAPTRPREHNRAELESPSHGENMASESPRERQ
jgi:molybdopterin-biosynthesis enzyme MoeA-like protein